MIASRIDRQDKIRIRQYINNEWVAYDPVMLTTKTGKTLQSVWPSEIVARPKHTDYDDGVVYN